MSTYPNTGGSPYDAIIITSEADITRYHAEATRGRHELVILTEDGCSHVGDIHVSVCHVCYSCHYVVFDLAGTELSAELELGFDCLADAIRCLLEASGKSVHV
jgi:hypothetical protein